MLHLRKHLVPLFTIAFLVMNISLTICQSSGKLARANAAYEKLAYSPAIDLYKSVLDDVEDFDAMWKLADCYRLTNQYAEAEYWYGRVTGHTDARPEHYLFYAQVLQVNEKYSEAAKWYENNKDNDPNNYDDAIVKNQIKNLYKALMFKRKFPMANMLMRTIINSSH